MMSEKNRKYEFSDLAPFVVDIPSSETGVLEPAAAIALASNHLVEEFSHSSMKNSSTCEI